MTTEQIAATLIGHCRRNDFAAAQHELFAADAVSIEPQAHPPFAKETVGLENILTKGKIWDGMIKETHHLSVSEPLIAGNCFAVTLNLDVTMHDNQRMNISEICLYKVKDGKIISEQFFM